MTSRVVVAARETAWTEPDASAQHAEALGHWALQHLAAGGSENPVRVWRLAGSPQPEALLAALREVLGRHDILRTCYPERGGMVAPHRLPPRALVLHTRDTGEAAVAALLRAETERPFDVAHDLPVRALLLLLPSGEQRLAVVAHGLCCDAGSLDLIGAELDAVLTQPANGTAARPFADHAGWLLRRFAGPEAEADLAWWRTALAGVPPADLPPDAPPDWGIVRESLALPPALALLLGGIADDAAGPDPLLAPAAAALAVLLRRWTGEADMVFGAEMSGRRAGPDAGTVGRFATLVAVHLDLSGEPSGVALLARAGHAAQAAWARRHVPFQRLADILADGEAGWDTLLPVRLAVRRAPVAGKHLIALPGPVAVPHGRLGLSLRLEADGSAWLDAAGGLYRAATVRRVLSGWALALAALLQSPDTKVARIDVLTAAERRHLLSLNDTARTWPQTPAIRLIEARAREAPARVALLCGEQATTYGDLLDAADRLAAALRARVIGRDTRVGLLLPRGAAMVTALLAVQKAGAAYVPLDPAFPPDRLADMLADCGAVLVVAHSAFRDRLAGAGTPRLELDRDPWREAVPVVAPDISPDDEAYVIYTSGSTGRPKGVAVPHRALTNFLHAMQESPGMGAADTMLFATTLSFDIAGLEIYLPLLAGARVAIATDDEAGDGAALVDLVARHRVGIVQAGPTRLELMLDAGWRPYADGPALRILTGGEPVSRPLARRLAPLGEVWNMYGPTETTIWSTCRRIAPDDTDTDAAGPVPIGRPIANTRVYVLDEAGLLLPLGAAGELCIAGHGVATGYVDRPALTEERFPPDPFGPGRMYRTGDRVRWRHDDTLEFLSRLDHQVKLRGVRIEPGEVEAALLRHPGLRQALVVLGRDRTGEAALIAYAVPADPAAWPAIRRELPGLLAARLPRAMLPQALVMLPALPLLANGKIDRSRLPPPPLPALDRVPDAVGMDDVAQHLAAIWRDVLQLPSVGLADNFFDLGGTSLLAARLQARIRDAFGRRVSLADLYRAPRLADLADLVAREPPAEAPDAETVQVVHLQRLGEAPPVFGVNNTTVFYPVAMHLHPKRPFVAVEIRKLRALTQAPDADLTDIAATYLAAVRAIRPHGPYVLLGWCAGAVLAYDLAQQLRAQDEQVAVVAMVDPSPPGPVAGFGPRLIAAGQRLRTDVARHGGSVLRRLRPTATADAAEQDLDIVDRKLVAYLERAADAYQPRAYGGRVLLFAPDRARAPWMADPIAGWRALAPNASVHRVPGDHVTMLRGDGARFIAERIGDALAGG